MPDPRAQERIREEANTVCFDENGAMPDPGEAQPPFVSFWHASESANAFFQVS